MFEGMRKAIKSIVEKISEKEITEKDLETILKELKYALVQNDVAFPVAKEIVEIVKKALIGAKIRRFTNFKKVVVIALKKEILRIFNSVEYFDLLEEVKKRRKENVTHNIKEGIWKPYVLLFLGPNGAGKTVTVAKLANLFKREGLIPVIAASDTFRAGAIEQIEKHARKIGVTLIKREYKSDPASVAYDAINHAIARKKDVVLIDTAGRLGTNIDLMEEMKKIARVSKPDKKIFVIDALAGNDLVTQATQFKEHVGIDGNILTKVDADVKGGAALSLVYVTKAPIIYIGVGQGYNDLQKFDPNWFLSNILMGLLE